MKKLIRYFGTQLAVTGIHNWIAADSDGRIFSYDARPHYITRLGGWLADDRKSHIDFVCYTEQCPMPADIEPCNSLRKIDDLMITEGE